MAFVVTQRTPILVSGAVSASNADVAVASRAAAVDTFCSKVMKILSLRLSGLCQSEDRINKRDRITDICHRLTATD